MNLQETSGWGFRNYGNIRGAIDFRTKTRTLLDRHHVYIGMAENNIEVGQLWSLKLSCQWGKKVKRCSSIRFLFFWYKGCPTLCFLSLLFVFPRQGWLVLNSWFLFESICLSFWWCWCLHSRRGVWPRRPQEEQPRGSSLWPLWDVYVISQPGQGPHPSVAKHQPQGQRQEGWRKPWMATGMKATSSAWAALGLWPAAAALERRQGTWALRFVKSQYLLQGPRPVSEQLLGHHEVGSVTKALNLWLGWDF